MTDRTKEQPETPYAWREVKRDGEFVLVAQKASHLTRWYHEHSDGSDFGHHPMDFDAEAKAYFCRDCNVGADVHYNFPKRGEHTMTRRIAR